MSENHPNHNLKWFSWTLYPPLTNHPIRNSTKHDRGDCPHRNQVSHQFWK